MTTRKAWMVGLLGVAAFASAPWAEAQVGGLPGAGAPLPGAGAAALGGAPTALGGAAPVAAAAPQKTLWGFLGLSKSNLATCRAKLCASQFGQLLNGMTLPASAITGGIVPLLCPPVPTASQLAGMQALGGAGGAQATAAKIMQDEADAKARVAAVEYLGTVDCRYWPEAKTALINALRADRNECVRFAAASVLGSGCCCSKEVIEKLRIVVSGSEEDGSPAEVSPRVRAAAFTALQNCLCKVPEVIPPEEPMPLTPEGGPAPLPDAAPRLVPERSAKIAGDPAAVAAGYASQQPAPAASAADKALSRKTFGQTVEDARRTMFEMSRTPQPTMVLPPGKQSVFHALVKARKDADSIARRRAAAQQGGASTSAPAATHDHSADAAIDPALRPTSFVVPTNSGRAVPPFQAEAAPIVEDVRASMNNRGLIGYFFKSKNQTAGAEE